MRRAIVAALSFLGETRVMEHLAKLLDTASAFLVALAILVAVLKSRR